MKIFCLMCGALVRELEPNFVESDIACGICPVCREKAGSKRRSGDLSHNQRNDRAALWAVAAGPFVA